MPQHPTTSIEALTPRAPRAACAPARIQRVSRSGPVPCSAHRLRTLVPDICGIHADRQECPSWQVTAESTEKPADTDTTVSSTTELEAAQKDEITSKSSKPVEGEPAPTETSKPVEGEPATETSKPVEGEPAAETLKPVEGEPAPDTSKPVEPAAETSKPVEGEPAPMETSKPGEGKPAAEKRALDETENADQNVPPQKKQSPGVQGKTEPVMSAQEAAAASEC